MAHKITIINTKIIRQTFLFWLLFFSSLVFGQQFSNIRFEQVGKLIHIYYDLQGDQEYAILVYCSTDDGQTWGNPLKKITGDTNEGQIPGNNKKIVWDVLADRGKLSGEIRFKLEALSGISVGTFTDPRDGQIYRWVKIGSQKWMAENLNYSINSKSWCYDNDPKNCHLYGRLYDWKTIMNGSSSINSMPSGIQGICPDGWHIPSDAEWDKLIHQLGGSGKAGGKLKEAGTEHWEIPNIGANNSSGFSALAAGTRLSIGSYRSMKYQATFWSTTVDDNYKVMCLILDNIYEYLSQYSLYKNVGRSVRCIKD